MRLPRRRSGWSSTLCCGFRCALTHANRRCAPVLVGWSGAKCSIDGTAVPQERFPDKRVFRLTPAGEEQLDGWLDGAELEAYQFRLPFLLKVLFGHRQSPDRTARLLADIRADAQARQDEYRSFLAALPAAPYAAYARLTVLYGLRVAEATAAWAEEAGGLLPAERVSINPRRESRTAPAMFALAPKLPRDAGEAR